MNSAINSWHLTDWTYQEFYKEDSRFQDNEKIDKKGNTRFIPGIVLYQQFLTKQCSELEYMRLITNGVKHCILKDSNRKEETVVKPGAFSSAFSSSFDTSRFVIQIDTNKIIDFEEVLLKTINFWESYIKNTIKRV